MSDLRTGMTAAAATVAVARPRRDGLVGFLGTAGIVAGAGFAQGGYFPTAWGWTALALAWAGAVTIALGPRVTVSRWGVAFAAAVLALAAWIAVSWLWTTSPTQTPLEVERSLVYVAAAIVAMTAATRVGAATLAGAVVAGVTLVCLYALGTRLAPDRLGTYDPIAGYRLAEPIGYWNGLGAFAAIAAVAALGLAARAPSRAARAAAAAGVPVLATTIYFTFSRGAWIALFAALVVLVALDARRLQLLAAAVVPVAAAAGAVAYASSRPALTHVEADLAAATVQGRHAAGVVLLAALVAAAAGFGVAALEPRVRTGRTVHRAAGAVLLVLAAAALALVFVRFGDPLTLTRDTAHRFAAAPPATHGDLNARLFTLSGSGRWQQWLVAWDGWRESPGGIGAGAFERYWLQHRDYPGQIRDVHNLYLEVLTELGPVGLTVLLAAVALPLAAAVRLRRKPLVPALAAAWLVYVLHAVVDWDWELPALGLAAVACAAGVLAQARPSVRLSRRALAGALAAVGLLALGGLASNVQLGRASAALRDEDAGAAISSARRATTWAPWSARPWQRLAEAYVEQGRNGAARDALEQAISRDDGDWLTWYELAQVTTGPDRDAALRRAKRLNPLLPPLAV